MPAGGFWDVIIAGGGAAGMMAAIIARRQGAGVVLLERNPRVGRKLLATGNGRCNYTNLAVGPEYYHGTNPGFVTGALAQFGVPETLAFFEELGIAPKIEEQGKVFPMSEQASSVLDVLRYEMENLGVEVVCDAFVTGIKQGRQGLSVQSATGNRWQGKRVVLASGGKAMPASGSDGNGLALAAALGHRVVPVFPALVQLKLTGQFFKQIEGVKVAGTAAVLAGDRVVAQDRGDLLFTNYGISGPPILQISRKAGELLRDNREPWLQVTLLDTLPPADLDRILQGRFAARPAKSLEFSLVGLINKRLIPVILKEAGIPDLKRPVAGVTPAERQRIVNQLTNWRFGIRGTKAWSSAQVTAGGVDTGEVNPDTMESNLVKGLYFAGEVLDIDGCCGGFNLQWAWSSGYVAGHAAGSSKA